MKERLEILVLGGSAAGPSAASRARRLSAEAGITIYEKGDFVSYGA
jgi:hypothetical protein